MLLDVGIRLLFSAASYSRKILSRCEKNCRLNETLAWITNQTVKTFNSESLFKMCVTIKAWLATVFGIKIQGVRARGIQNYMIMFQHLKAL